MRLYSGMDLHSNTTHIAIMDEKRQRLIDRKVRNDPELILRFLEPYRASLEGIVVESTYNWYWLVDMLREQAYRVHLAHPVANQQYHGLKHSDDRHDAFWLAELLSLGVLKEGYIYPRELRSVRDLLRKRLQLVRYRSALILSVKNGIHRNRGITVEASQIKRLGQEGWSEVLKGDEALWLATSLRMVAILYGLILLTGSIVTILNIFALPIYIRPLMKEIFTFKTLPKSIYPTPNPWSHTIYSLFRTFLAIYLLYGWPQFIHYQLSLRKSELSLNKKLNTEGTKNE